MKPCTNLGCDYAIKDPGYMNCSFVAGEAGEHTLEAVASMMNLTREGVRLIEKRGLQKLRDGLENHDESCTKTTASHQPRPLPRRSNVVSLHQATECEEEDHQLSAVDDRELG